jgi:hypothetical protein
MPVAYIRCVEVVVMEESFCCQSPEFPPGFLANLVSRLGFLEVSQIKIIIKFQFRNWSNTAAHFMTTPAPLRSQIVARYVRGWIGLVKRVSLDLWQEIQPKQFTVQQTVVESARPCSASDAKLLKGPGYIIVEQTPIPVQQSLTAHLLSDDEMPVM